MLYFNTINHKQEGLLLLHPPCPGLTQHTLPGPHHVWWNTPLLNLGQQLVRHHEILFKSIICEDEAMGPPLNTHQGGRVIIIK